MVLEISRFQHLSSWFALILKCAVTQTTLVRSYSCFCFCIDHLSFPISLLSFSILVVRFEIDRDSFLGVAIMIFLFFVCACPPEISICGGFIHDFAEIGTRKQIHLHSCVRVTNKFLNGSSVSTIWVQVCSNTYRLTDQIEDFLSH